MLAYYALLQCWVPYRVGFTLLQYYTCVIFYYIYVVVCLQNVNNFLGKKFLSPEVDLDLYKSTLKPCMEYCCHSGLLPPVNTWIYSISQRNVYAGLLVQHLLPLLNPWLITEMQLVYFFSIEIFLEDVHLNWLNWFHFLILVAGAFIILIDCIIFLSLFLYVIRMSVSTVSFFAQLDSEILCLQNAFL